MSELPITIPTLLREKLGRDFDADDIWGYKYTSGYWEEDETSWDCPIRDFIEEPEIHVFVKNDKKEQLVTIRKKDILSETDTAFEDLRQWLTVNYGNGHDAKTDGVFGVVKENGKYMVEFGRVIDYHSRWFCSLAGMVKEKITKLLPEGFRFIGKENDWRWHWVHHGDEGRANVFCEICPGFSTDDHWAYYHFDIWHDADNSRVNSSVQENELGSACCRIARMLSDEYPDMYEYVLVIARYVDSSTMGEMGRVEFDVPLNCDETWNLRRLLFSSEFFYPDNLRWHDRELFHKIEKKAEKKLVEAFQFDPTQFLTCIDLRWAVGERQRLIGRLSSLTEENIQRMISYIDSLDGKEPPRYELLGVARGSFVWKEVWTCETGHMWEKYTLLKRTPSDEELEYADCSQYAVWLSDLSTETIVELLKEYKS